MGVCMGICVCVCAGVCASFDMFFLQASKVLLFLYESQGGGIRGTVLFSPRLPSFPYSSLSLAWRKIVNTVRSGGREVLLGGGGGGCSGGPGSGSGT